MPTRRFALERFRELAMTQAEKRDSRRSANSGECERPANRSAGLAPMPREGGCARCDGDGPILCAIRFGSGLFQGESTASNAAKRGVGSNQKGSES